MYARPGVSGLASAWALGALPSALPREVIVLRHMARALAWATFTIFINGASHAQTTDPIGHIHAPPTPMELTPVSNCPRYPSSKIEIAVHGIMQQSLVRDAAIVQDGCLLKLAILANPIVTKDHAKQLGDNFVRLTKTFGPGQNPGREIGAGVYEYMVGVYESGSQKNIVLGGKSPRGKSIRW